MEKSHNNTIEMKNLGNPLKMNEIMSRRCCWDFESLSLVRLEISFSEKLFIKFDFPSH